MLQLFKKGEISDFISIALNAFQKIDKDQAKEMVLELFILLKIFIYFGNNFMAQILADSLFQIYDQDIPIENDDELIKIINIKKIINNDNINDEQYKNEIKYIQKYFLEINPEIINEIDEIIIEKAITSSDFQIFDEDSFLYQILNLKNEYAQYFLRFVVFTNLSYSAIGLFLKSFNFYDIDEHIWESLSSRLLLPNNEDSFINHRLGTSMHQIVGKTFIYQKGHEFEGSFNYLNKRCRGNAHLKGIIEISSNGDEYNNSYDIIDKNFDSYFYPKSPNSYIQINFKSYRFSLSHYSLKSNQNKSNKLINWEIIGSNDLKNWIQIDERHIQIWNGSKYENTYSTKNSQAYQYFQIRLKGCDSSNENYLDLSAIEFFGSVK